MGCPGVSRHVSGRPWLPSAQGKFSQHRAMFLYFNLVCTKQELLVNHLKLPDHQKFALFVLFNRGISIHWSQMV